MFDTSTPLTDDGGGLLASASRRFLCLLFALLLGLPPLSCDDGGQRSRDILDAEMDGDDITADVGPVCGLEACSPGEICCDFSCVDPTSDDTNCGGCDVVCAEGQACVDGRCTCGSQACSPTQTCCETDTQALLCVDLRKNAEHCGECGESCEPTENCLGGRCLCSGAATQEICRAEETCCPGTGCTDLQSNPLHCGACGHACGPGEQCFGGLCTCGDAQATASSSACLPGEACCGSPPTCRPGDDPECSCGTVTCGSGQSCCEVELNDGSVEQICVSIWRDPTHCGSCGASCGPGQRCAGSSCVCEPGLDDCNQDNADGCEVALNLDPQHCGACGAACPAGSVCNGQGECNLSCAPGWIECDGICVDPATNPSHCGACGNACPSGELCDGTGVCAVSCQPGYAECDGRCRDLLRAREACGTCNTVCGPGHVCDGRGRCAVTCQAGLVDCGGRCTNLLVAPNHCGACGNACEPGRVCDLGTCEVECRGDRVQCGRTCVDLAANPNHCGACGNVCGPGEACRDGACGLVCAEGLTACSGLCVDLDTDRRHCGECDASCPPGTVCDGAVCTGMCPDGWDDCGAGCIELASDPDNCGACGDSCPAGTTCLGGACCTPGAACDAVVDVDTEFSHTCAAFGNGRVACWGVASDARLGFETAESFSEPVFVDAYESVDMHAVAVATGVDFSCALDLDGAVRCWGANVYGQLGTSVMGGPDPVTVPLPAPATDIVAGVEHACAVLVTGEVSCWGDNSYGQLGRESTADVAPGLVPLDGVAVDIDTGGVGSCAVLLSGELQCWGDWCVTACSADACNNCPPPGPYFVMDESGAPLLDVEQVTVGDYYACALTTGGRVSCWGFNSYGVIDPLENGMVPETTQIDLARDITDDIAPSSPIVQLDTSQGFHTCAVDASGEVTCWGDNERGQLGADCATDGRTGCVRGTPPVVVRQSDGSPLTDVTSVTTGFGFTCALTSTGSVRCWGTNTHAQVGVAPGIRPDVERITAAISRNAVVSVDAGTATCAVLDDDTLECWGDDPPVAPTAAPTQVPGVSEVSTVGVGTSGFRSDPTACFVTNSGAVMCWGGNTTGTLGNGTTADSLTPTPPRSRVSMVKLPRRSTSLWRRSGPARCSQMEPYNAGVGDRSVQEGPSRDRVRATTWRAYRTTWSGSTEHRHRP